VKTLWVKRLPSIAAPILSFRALRDLVTLATKHRELTLLLAKREITDRYAGQVFGVFWAAGHPVLLMLVYVTVFGYALNLRAGGSTALPFDYTVYLLSGLIPWLGFQETVQKSTTVIRLNAPLVKQVVFPIEVLPVKTVLACLASQVATVAAFLIYVVIRFGSLPWTCLWLPVPLLLQVLLMIGLGYLLSATGVYFRDLKDVVQVLLLAGVYALPVIYPPSILEGNAVIRKVLWCNPVSHVIWCYQDICYFGEMAHPWSWLIFGAMSALALHLGYLAFCGLKHHMGDVL